jgi:hypothetical protein
MYGTQFPYFVSEIVQTLKYTFSGVNRFAKNKQIKWVQDKISRPKTQSSNSIEPVIHPVPGYESMLFVNQHRRSL